MTGRTILTAEEMRAAEAVAIAAGTPVEALTERAGIAAAEAIWRYAGPLPTLVLCGPGNNGGDGYVIARELRARGVGVRVAALAEPKSDAARAARDAWDGRVESLAEARPAAMLLDSLFGTGLARPLEAAVSSRLRDLAAAAQVSVAIDLPSGVATDDGQVLSPVPDYDLTITFQTLKPSHLLQSAARHMGRVVVADIGIAAQSRLHDIGPAVIPEPGPDDHKYRRGYVVVIAGEMPGASVLAASAAARAGAGYVRLIGADRTWSSRRHCPRSRRFRKSARRLPDRRGRDRAGPGPGRRGEASARACARLRPPARARCGCARALPDTGRGHHHPARRRVRPALPEPNRR